MDSAISAAHHRVLIPEILCKILEPLPNGTLFSAALVCQSWSDMALDVIWKEIPHLLCLFQILAPMEIQEEYWRFSVDFDTVANNNWQHFANHSRRVRSLNCWADSLDTTAGQFLHAAEILRVVKCCQLYGQSELMPNVVNIHWDWRGAWTRDLPQVDSTGLPLCITPNLRGLTLFNWTPGLRTAILNDLHTIATVKNGSLLRLHIHKYISGTIESPIKKALALCIRRNPAMQDLQLPLCHPTYDLLQAVYTAREVRRLEITVACLGGLPQVSQILANLAEGCPQLHCLCLDFDPDTTYHQMALHVLRPLHKLHSLSKLLIDFPAGFHFTESEIIEMGVTWPQIQLLRLSTSHLPVMYDDKDPPLSTISLFAKHFSPSLTSLNLTLSSAETITTSDNFLDYDLPKRGRFSQLFIKLRDIREQMEEDFYINMGRFLGPFVLDGGHLAVRLPGMPDRRDGAALQDRGIHMIHHTVCELLGSNADPKERRTIQDCSSQAPQMEYWRDRN